MVRDALLCVGLAALASCATSRVVLVPVRAEPPPAGAVAPHPEAGGDSGRARELVQEGVFAPLRSLFNSPGWVRGLAGMRAEAYNVTASDGVSDANWFLDRNAGRRLLAADIVRGPGGEPPDTAKPWMVVAARLDREPPVLTIHDASGREYWLTFDAAEHAELATATEMISARLFWVAGFHTPEMHLVTFDPARQLAAGDTFGVARSLARAARRSDGRVRAVAHRIPGRPLGPFGFAGRRAGDPADSVPHEHRRELRGLYVVAAWLNHTDLFRGNTLDVLVDSAVGATVRHYVLGFEASLGSRGGGGVPKRPRDGVEANWDSPRVGARLLTLGFYAAPWERTTDSGSSSLGRYPANGFDPSRWTPGYPNQAFARRTVRDGYWGAKLVANVSEAQIRAAVRAGLLSDSAAAEALVQALMIRRARTVRHWLARVTPLDELGIPPGAGGLALTFRDLAVAEGLAPPAGRQYEVRLSLPAAKSIQAETERLDLSPDGRGTIRLPATPADAWSALKQLPVERRLAWLDVHVIPERGAPTPRGLRVYLLPGPEEGWRIVGRRY